MQSNLDKIVVWKSICSCVVFKSSIWPYIGFAAAKTEALELSVVVIPAFARMNCTPKLSEESAKVLQNYYIEDRKKYNENKIKKGNDIPVTVRQLEAIIRLSEAIAKCL